MDTSEIIEQLRKRIDETARDRNRLSEVIGDLDRAIAQLENEEHTVERLVKQYSNGSSPALSRELSTDPSVPPAAPSEDRPDEDHDDSVDVRWPVGARHNKPIKAKKAKSWARYKLAAADWYLGTLREIVSADQRVKRAIGIEMAIDGVLQSLGAAFDAAIYALTNTIERAAKVPKVRRTPVHLANWSKIAAEAKFFGIELASSLSISDSLIGEHLHDPQGWLAQLLVLRRRSVGEDVLIITNVSRTEQRELYLDVPGRGEQPLVAYLSEMRNLIAELLETIMHDISDAKSGRLCVAAIDQLREHAEHDLGDLLSSDRTPKV